MQEYIIRPVKGLSLNLKEIWINRELLFFFAWRDIKVKYKQTVFGFLWVILQPVVMVTILTLFFGRVLNVDTGGIPYPIFVLSGLILWNFFSSSVTGASNSMVENSNIIKKVYFPRLVIPISSILVALVDFFITFVIFIVMMIYYHDQIDIIWWRMLLFMPLAIFMVVLTAFGLGTLLSALNVKYRDFRYALPFFIQILFFVSPIVYSLSFIKNETIQFIQTFNPIAMAVMLVRSIMTSDPVNYMWLLNSGATIVVIFIAGLLYFRKTESYFADLV